MMGSTMMIELALGRACHFCGDRTTRNYRVRRAAEGAPPEDLTVPLCARHRLLLQSAGPAGRLHKPTGVRWYLDDAQVAEATTVCPVNFGTGRDEG